MRLQDYVFGYVLKEMCETICYLETNGPPKTNILINTTQYYQAIIIDSQKYYTCTMFFD